MKHRAQQGFTLIELMMVVAIVGIMAAVALPTYQDYTTRTKVTELILAASPCRLGISELLQTGSEADLSTQLKNACANTATKYVESVTVSGEGEITIQANAKTLARLQEGERTLTITPMVKNADGALEVLTAGTAASAQLHGWVCGARTTGTSIQGKTTIEAKYLPSSCQGSYP